MSSIVLDKSLEALILLVNGAVDESLPAASIRNSWPAETRSVDRLERTLRLSLTTAFNEWKQRLEAVIKDNGAQLTNFTFIIIIEFNSGTIKIELDNTMWTVQPEQGRKD